VIHALIDLITLNKINMRIYNATKGTMNLPMANGSRLIIGSMEVSRQFYPTVELLNLLVSAYSRDDIAIIIDSSAEISMGATVSALPGYVADSLEEAIMRFKKPEKEEIKTPREDKTKISQDTQSKVSEKVDKKSNELK
jgi:hypothetical protein